MVLLPNNKLVFFHIVKGKATELLIEEKSLMKTVKADGSDSELGEWN